MDEQKKVGRPKGTPKTGGRVKGTPNKATLSFSDVLDKLDFSIPEQAVELFQTTKDENLKFKILSFLAEYRHAKVKEAEVTPKQDEPDNQLAEVSTADLLKLVKGGGSDKPNS